LDGVEDESRLAEEGCVVGGDEGWGEVGELVVGQSEEASIDSGGHYTEGSRHGRGKVSLEAGMRKREGGRREGTRSQEEAASSVERRAGQNAELTVMTTDEERLERAIREGE
jgi:hypothetical protein